LYFKIKKSITSKNKTLTTNTLKQTKGN